MLLYSLGQYLARLQTPGLQSFLFGVAVVIVVMFLPQGAGLSDLWKRFWDKVVWFRKEPHTADD